MATDGYQALREGAALLDVSGLTRIRVTGEDRVRLLHAVASNEIESLRPGEGVETFFLNPKGRIQAVARVYMGENEVRLECDAGRRQILLEYLASYIIMDDVALDDETDSIAAFAVEGPTAEDVAAEATLLRAPGETAHAWVQLGGFRIYRSTLTGQPGVRVEIPTLGKEGLGLVLAAKGAVTASEEDFRAVRVENRVPSFGEDYSDRNIPHETQQLTKLSYTKGCYVGQEIVERVRSMGQVNRLLVPLAIDSHSVPSETAMLFEGREAGRLTSPVLSPRWGDVRGFALLRREAATPGTRLEVDGVQAEVLEWS